MALNEIPVPDGHAIIDLELKTFSEVKPDLSLELRIDTIKLTFDLLVELDLTARPSYNREKFLAYDAFLCGWALAHTRRREQRTRPAVVFVCQDPRSMLACARAADEAMSGRIGVMSTPAEHWYYAGREHMFFAVESDIHHGNLNALALPPEPPALRERLTGSRELTLTTVSLLAPTVVEAARANVVTGRDSRPKAATSFWRNRPALVSARIGDGVRGFESACSGCGLEREPRC